MENVKQILDELDDGYKYFAIKKDGCWYRIEFDSFMVKDIERAQNICSELNQMLKNACEGKKADTGENNALLPDVRKRAFKRGYKKGFTEGQVNQSDFDYSRKH
jgi:hypothetical protein